MILSRTVKTQLLAILVLFVVALVVLGQVFLRVPEAVGIGRYTVTAAFSDGAGLYPGAEVTFLGDPVGSVTDMEIAHPGVTVTMSIESSAGVPRQIEAEIHSHSAVGEQYVDLVPHPKASSTVLLAGGDVIPMADTSVPVQVPKVLDDVDALLKSVPTKRLNSLLHETSTALRGRDGDLQALIDHGSHLVQTAQGSIAPTRELIRQFGPLAGAVTSTGGSVDRYTRNLAAVTNSLKVGDGYFRALLADAPGSARDTAALLQALSPRLQRLLGSLGVVAEVLATYNPGLAEIFTDYPTLTAAAQSLTLPFAQTHQIPLDLADLNQPTACIKGFIPSSQWRDPSITSLTSTPYVHCALPDNAPTVVKGARNLLCERYPGVRAATPAECARKAHGR